LWLISSAAQAAYDEAKKEAGTRNGVNELRALVRRFLQHAEGRKNCKGERKSNNEMKAKSKQRHKNARDSGLWWWGVRVWHVVRLSRSANMPAAARLVLSLPIVVRAADIGYLEGRIPPMLDMTIDIEVIEGSSQAIAIVVRAGI
jgi:hypothetical protein